MRWDFERDQSPWAGKEDHHPSGMRSTATPWHKVVAQLLKKKRITTDDQEDICGRGMPLPVQWCGHWEVMLWPGGVAIPIRMVELGVPCRGNENWKWLVKGKW